MNFPLSLVIFERTDVSFTKVIVFVFHFLLDQTKIENKNYII